MCVWLFWRSYIWLTRRRRHTRIWTIKSLIRARSEPRGGGGWIYGHIIDRKIQLADFQFKKYVCFCIARRVSCEIWNWKYVHIRIYFLMKAHNFFFFFYFTRSNIASYARWQYFCRKKKTHVCAAARSARPPYIYFNIIILSLSTTRGVLVYVMKILLADARARQRDDDDGVIKFF